MGAHVDRNISLEYKDNKGVPCRCVNSDCDMYGHRLNRPRRENSLGICRTCGMNVRAIENTREVKKYEAARKDFELINSNPNISISRIK